MAYKTQILCILLCSPLTHIQFKSQHIFVQVSTIKGGFILRPPRGWAPIKISNQTIKVSLIFPARTSVQLMPVYSRQRLFIRIVKFGIYIAFKLLCFENRLFEARTTGSIVSLFYEHSLSGNRIASRSFAFNEWQYKCQWIGIVPVHWHIIDSHSRFGLQIYRRSKNPPYNLQIHR